VLYIHHSNRLERLFDELAGIMTTPLPDPMQPEVVVVQSQGMARWLALRLAASRGICANLDCPFPAALIWRLFAARHQAIPPLSPYDVEALPWAVMTQLATLRRQPGFETLDRYLGREVRPIKQYQLAERIAAVFDQYLVYRPDWIMGWEQGRDDHWQAGLWRGLRERLDGPHRAALLFDLLGSLNPDLTRAANLPERLFLFGIPALPQSYFEVFAALAKHLDVHLLLLNPCRAFWQEIVSERHLARLALRQGGPQTAGPDMYYDTGNELLAMLGTMGQDFQALLQQYDAQENDCFEEPDPSTLLGRLQADILDSLPGDRADGEWHWREEDRSVRIHVAHSPMREVEILHDQLLELFSRDPDLTPAEVLVMTPDIGRYGPFIEAVFGAAAHGRGLIPYSIADRQPREESQAVKVFLDLLDLGADRLGAGRVLALLDVEPVRERFAIRAEEVGTIRDWVRDTRIFWGLDGSHRAALGLPAVERGTWRHGLDRMVLGYALPGDGHRFFGDLLPYDLIEGSDGDLLGRLHDFLDSVGELARQLDLPRPVEEWSETMRRIMDRFLRPGDDIELELRDLRYVLDRMGRGAAAARFEEPVALEVAKAHVERSLAQRGGRGNFLTGRVTFCQMVPMRSIPGRVICLLGMEDGAFPRMDRPPGFDLMTGDFRVGDRSRRGDDRYLFLEAILSARRCLYLSYVGRDIRDDAATPPSVVIDGLLEQAGRMTGLDRAGITARLVTCHPLQPFSHRYFQEEGPLFSYSRSALHIARAAGSAVPRPAIVAAPLVPEETDGTTVVELAAFIRFFENPVREFLRQRLGLSLDEKLEEWPDREPFSLDGLDRYRLSGDLVARELAGERHHDAYRVHLAGGELPEGSGGRLEFRRTANLAAEFAARLRRMRGQDDPRPAAPLYRRIDRRLGRLRLTGRLELWPAGQYLFRPTRLANLRYRDLVDHWLLHLVLNDSLNDSSNDSSNNARHDGGDDSSRHTFFITLDGGYGLAPLDNAGVYLPALADWYERGLTEPLPLPPRAGFAYAAKLWGPKGVDDPESRDRALQAGSAAWHEVLFAAGGQQSPPEKQDPYMQTAFGDRDPLEDPRFHDLAALLLGEPLRRRVKIR